jgi:hypothetical protein
MRYRRMIWVRRRQSMISGFRRQCLTSSFNKKKLLKKLRVTIDQKIKALIRGSRRKKKQGI